MAGTYGTLYRNGVNYSYDTAESISYDSSAWGSSYSDIQNLQQVIDQTALIRNAAFNTGEFVVFQSSKDRLVPGVIMPNGSPSSTNIFSLTDNVDAGNFLISDNNLVNSYMARVIFSQSSSSTTASNLFSVLMWQLPAHRTTIVKSRTASTVGWVRFRWSENSGEYYFETYGFGDSTTLYLHRINLIPLCVPKASNGQLSIGSELIDINMHSGVNSDVYGKLYRNSINYSHDTAASISFDNSATDLTSTNAQDVADELHNTLFGCGEQVVIVDKTEATSGIAAETLITLNARAKKIFQNDQYFVVACFTSQAQFTTASSVWMVIDRIYGHYLLAVGNTANNIKKGAVRIDRPDKTVYKICFQQYGFPSGTNLYLQKLIFIDQKYNV